jgi:rubredoxin
MICPNCSKDDRPVSMYRVEKKDYYTSTASYTYKIFWICPECGLEIEALEQNVQGSIRRDSILP